MRLSKQLDDGGRTASVPSYVPQHFPLFHSMEEYLDIENIHRNNVCIIVFYWFNLHLYYLDNACTNIHIIFHFSLIGYFEKEEIIRGITCAEFLESFSQLTYNSKWIELVAMEKRNYTPLLKPKLKVF